MNNFGTNVITIFRGKLPEIAKNFVFQNFQKIRPPLVSKDLNEQVGKNMGK